jgi:hypothetical protein
MNNDTTIPGILLNGNWQKTDYFVMGVDSQSTGIAHFITLEKDVCNIEHQAILYLAQRFAIETEGWDEAIIADLNAENCINFIFGQGYIAGDSGEHISNEEFLKFYEQLTNGMFIRENFSIVKNGISTDDMEFYPIELVSVVCFSNNWNSVQYFIELATRWALFTWSTDT